MVHLPHVDRAIVDIRKLEQYCLNPEHLRGRHKARVFRQALGIRRHDSAWLRDALQNSAREAEALMIAEDSFGTRWRADLDISRHGRQCVVRTIWLAPRGEEAPRLITCWVR